MHMHQLISFCLEGVCLLNSSDIFHFIDENILYYNTLNAILNCKVINIDIQMYMNITHLQT